MNLAGNRLLILTALLQGAYYLLTGVWPLVSLDSFETVTGEKVDDWLVHTVGLLVTVSGTVFLLAAIRRSFPIEVLVLAVGNALSLAVIDVVYVSRGTISPVYLLDVPPELILAAGWIVGYWRQRPRRSASQEPT